MQLLRSRLRLYLLSLSLLTVPLLPTYSAQRGITLDLPSREQTPVSIFRRSPGALDQPDPQWAGKVLESVLTRPVVPPAEWKRYLAHPTKAEALADILASNREGFRDRLLEFNLGFIEFLPNQLYGIDPLTRARIPGRELAAFSNVRAAADAVLTGGDFFTLFDFPLDDLALRYSPFSNNETEQLTFLRDWVNKPFFRVLTNSLSNKNRKRAAWVLRNFLCDDLLTSASESNTDANADPLPALNIAQLRQRLQQADARAMAFHPALDAAPPSSQRHATEVGCRSCHWKLDYVGAFFRYYDSWGNNYRQRGKYLEFVSQIIYRDQAWDEWMSEWRTADNRWSAGIHRGALAPDPGDWDATTVTADPVPADLFRFLKTDAAAQRCLTRRMAQFYIGPNLSYESAWLDGLAARFAQRPPAASGSAYLEVLGALLFSRAYAESNPDPQTCYDRAPSQPPRRIPCGVFRILENQCLSCHRDGGLGIDLRDVVDHPSGRPWLNHRDSSGQLLPIATSYRDFLDRIDTEDSSVRMPYGKPPLSARDRGILRRWLDEMRGAP